MFQFVEKWAGSAGMVFKGKNLEKYIDLKREIKNDESKVTF